MKYIAQIRQARIFQLHVQGAAVLARNNTGKQIRMAITTALVLFMIELFRIGLADFMLLEPGAYLDAVRAANDRPSPVRLAAARERLLAARTLDPGNPVIPEYLGQISFYRATLANFDVQMQQDYLRDALENYETAISIRPNSGYLWAGVMNTRQALSDLSRLAPVPESSVRAQKNGTSGMADALRHAAQLAPWEPGVAEQIARIGTNHYMALSAQDRVIVDSASAREKILGSK
jgi:hypothetical protein